MDTWETAGGAMRRLLLFNCSVMSDSATPWAVAHQTPLSMGFPRQEYWSGLPFPYPGDLPNPGIEPRSPTLQADSLPGEPHTHTHTHTHTQLCYVIEAIYIISIAGPFYLLNFL